jgi:hypothetical protein
MANQIIVQNKIMYRIKIAFRTMTVAKILLIGRSIVTALTGNADFPTPDPSLTDVTKALDNLETAQENAINGGVNETAIRDSRLETAVNLLTILGWYVQWQAKGDKLKILSAGFEVIATSTVPIEMVKVQGVKAKRGALKGTIDVSWKPVKGSRTYLVEMTTDVNTDTWTKAGEPTKAKLTVAALTPGTNYWFRITAIGTLGAGPESDPATDMA